MAYRQKYLITGALIHSGIIPDPCINVKRPHNSKNPHGVKLTRGVKNRKRCK